MHKVSATDLIRDLFEQACLELFQTMDCDIQPLACDSVDSTYMPTAYIDAGTDDFELLLTLRLPLAALTMTYPIQEHILSVDESELEEWILELANRLLGLLKAKLILHDCPLKTGLPSYDFGQDSTQSINRCEYAPYFFVLDEEPIELGITLEMLRDDIIMTQQAKAGDNSIQAGELDFF
ncbi:MAG TPA: hypothetical protein VIC26_11725 [Marinagarivorans sp.]